MRWRLIIRLWLAIFVAWVRSWFAPRAPELPPGLSDEDAEDLTEYQRLVRAAEAAGVPRAHVPEPTREPGRSGPAAMDGACGYCHRQLGAEGNLGLCAECYASHLRETGAA